MAAGAVRTRLAPLANSRYRLLFLATLGSGIGNWLALIALQVDVYDRTHSGWWVGALLVGSILPAVFLGILFGPLVDRLSRKRLMVASDLGRLAVFAVLPFTSSAAAVVALAVAAGIGNAFFRPAVLAGLPNLVSDEELPQANALLQLVDWATTAAGPIVGGAIVAASGPDLAYAVNAVSWSRCWWRGGSPWPPAARSTWERSSSRRRPSTRATSGSACCGAGPARDSWSAGSPHRP